MSGRIRQKFKVKQAELNLRHKFDKFMVTCGRLELWKPPFARSKRYFNVTRDIAEMIRKATMRVL